jgi:hypothetical protein
MNKRNYQLEIQKLDSQIENLRAKVNVNLINQTGSAVCASPQTSSTIRLIDVGRPTSQAAPDVPESGRNYQLEIQELDSQIENLRAKVNVNLINQTGSAVCASPQTSSTIRLIDVGRPTSQAAPDVPESGKCIPPGVNGVSANKISRCNEVRNVSTIAGTGIESVSALSEKYVDSSHYNELSLPKFTDSSQQVAVHFVRELDEYFTLRKTPEELCLPLVFRAISDPFMKQWMLTAYGQLKSYDDFKRAFTELLCDSTRQPEIWCRVYQDRYDYRSGESFLEHYIRYANMASMLSPAMSNQDLLGAMVTHYEPRMQACLISVNVKSKQEALAVLSKQQSLENSREQYRATWWDLEHQDQTRRAPHGQPIDNAGNPNRDRNHRGNTSSDPRTNVSWMSFFRSQGRLDDGTDPQLNASAQEAGHFMLRSEIT